MYSWQRMYNKSENIFYVCNLGIGDIKLSSSNFKLEFWSRFVTLCMTWEALLNDNHNNKGENVDYCRSVYSSPSKLHLLFHGVLPKYLWCNIVESWPIAFPVCSTVQLLKINSVFLFALVFGALLLSQPSQKEKWRKMQYCFSESQEETFVYHQRANNKRTKNAVLIA